MALNNVLYVSNIIKEKKKGPEQVILMKEHQTEVPRCHYT